MEVISVPLTDQLKPINNLRVRTFFILNDRLDDEILRTALDRLIRDHWRKLGARLVTKKDGFLEYHLPGTFDEKYRLFDWSTQEYEHSIDKILSLPKATPPEEGVSLLPPLSGFESQIVPTHWPHSRSREKPDAPLLYIHLSLFTDATIVGTSCPHVVGDQLGLANILRAWLGIIKGETPPPMLGYDKDVLVSEKSYDEYEAKDVVRKGKMRVRRRMEYPFVILGFIPELVLQRKEKTWTVFLPQPLLQLLRERYVKELREKYGADPGISLGDIVTGIILKVSFHR